MPVGNEATHVLDGVTVKGGLKVGDQGPYIAPGDSLGLSVYPPRWAGSSAQGIEVPIGRLQSTQSFSTTSQNLRLTYFVAPRDMTVTTIEFSTTATAAGATPTLVRYGLYTVDIAGTITLAASTPNDTTLLAAATTAYPKALSTPYALVAGQTYATAFLLVTAAALPTLASPNVVAAALSASGAPALSRVAGQMSGQADLPTGPVTVGSITNSGTGLYCYLT